MWTVACPPRTPLKKSSQNTPQLQTVDFYLGGKGHNMSQEALMFISP